MEKSTTLNRNKIKMRMKRTEYNSDKLYSSIMLVTWTMKMNNNNVILVMIVMIILMTATADRALRTDDTHNNHSHTQLQFILYNIRTNESNVL